MTVLTPAPLWIPDSAFLWANFDNATIKDRRSNHSIVQSAGASGVVIDHDGKSAYSCPSDYNNYIYFSGNSTSIPNTFCFGLIGSFEENPNIDTSVDIYLSASIFGDYWGYLALAFGTNGLFLAVYDDNASDYVIAQSSFASYDIWVVIGVVISNSIAKLRINGADSVSVAISAPFFNYSGNTLGLAQTNWFLPQGGIYAEAVLSAELTDIEKIEGYLAHRWGKATLLEEGHPYRRLAPRRSL